MTEIECLHKMIVLWGCLAANPTYTKETAYVHTGLTVDHHDCPCCEYCKIACDSEQDEGCDHTGYLDMPNCPACPLADHWPEPIPGKDANGDYPYVYPCLALQSNFMIWSNALYSRDKQRAAADMVKDCYAVLEEIYGGSGSDFVSYYEHKRSIKQWTNMNA